ncbi:hypothetical protein AVEN_188987-1 [Araneus ventricosus]|uniref:Uncharacterized protein n=1 Tax=Araneus ventricosus TaxID=182803 RepID=A0A4Y2JLQ5_ARAVE|nr:hypothetical protein AVEN_188987-1 [Araneus ventricosus]
MGVHFLLGGISRVTGPHLCFAGRKASNSQPDGSEQFVTTAYISLPVFEQCWSRAQPEDRTFLGRFRFLSDVLIKQITGVLKKRGELFFVNLSVVTFQSNCPFLTLSC